MSDDDIENVYVAGHRRHRQEDALQLGPRKKPCIADPLIHHGRHFGRTVHALCSIRTLIQNGLHRTIPPASDTISTSQEAREHRIFLDLLRMIPGLEARLLDSSSEEIKLVADLASILILLLLSISTGAHSANVKIQKGVSSARSDDTKGLKGVILDWIVSKGQPLDPPLARNIKTDRGFHHDRTGYLLCPAGLDWSDKEIKEGLRQGHLHVPGDQWPIFLYRDWSYDPDDPWKGLLRSAILVSAYKHIFTSPSSVGKEAIATRSGNARIHGMRRVTPASISYVATQVRFSLCSSPVFSRSDTVTDSERFYSSVLELLEDDDEVEEVRDLLQWWNRQIFPANQSVPFAPAQNSVLAKIRAKRAATKAANDGARTTQ